MIIRNTLNTTIIPGYWAVGYETDRGTYGEDFPILNTLSQSEAIAKLEARNPGTKIEVRDLNERADWRTP